MYRSVPAAYDHHSLDQCLDMSPSYHSSPYSGSEVDFGLPSSHDDFGSPLTGAGMDLSGLSYVSPLPQDGFYSAPYILSQDHPEPPFYSTDGSPSPTISEPRTPESQGDCYMEIGHPGENTYLFDDVSATYRE
jgi:hypothetical protein